MMTSSAIPSAAAMSEFSLFFSSATGSRILEHQRENISELLSATVGYNCVQLSVNKAVAICDSGKFGHYVQLGYAPTLDEHQKDHVWTEYERLPVASECVDVLIIHHVLDFSSQPHELLREADRVLVDGGHLLIVSFKPWGAWEFYKRYLQLRNHIDKRALGLCKPVTMNRLNDWLILLNYDVFFKQSSYYLRSHKKLSAIAGRSGLFERSVRKILSPLGIYQICMARKKTHATNVLGSRWNVRKTIPVSARISEEPAQICEGFASKQRSEKVVLPYKNLQSALPYGESIN